MSLRIRLSNAVRILLVAALASGCQSLDDRVGPGAQATGDNTLSLGLIGSDGSGRPGGAAVSGPLRFVDGSGLEATLTHARVHLRHIELDLPFGMRCAGVRDQLAGGAVCKSDVSDDDGTPDQGSGDAPGTPGAEDSGTGAPRDRHERTILIRGPFVVDLLAGVSTPSLSRVRVPAVAYTRIDVRIDDGELGEGVLRSGDELIDRSLVVWADFVYMGTPVELRLSLKFNEDVRFEAPRGVPAGPELRLELEVDRWLSGIRLADCLDGGDLVVEDGVLLVDDDSARGECSDLEGDIKDNVKNSARLGG
jgi:hypothetical protein